MAALALGSAALVAAACFFTGSLWFNMPSHEEYPVWGVDVSHWQGDIDWTAMAAEGIDFVFIKATEGQQTTDPFFEDNWQEAHDAGLLAGAYHALSDETGGAEQAGHFIETVPWDDTMLPPVIDLEVDERSETAAEVLEEMVAEIESHYGVKPILYVTHGTYEAFVMGKYEDCPIWISDIFREPELADGREWLLWNYSGSGWMPGYEGEGWNIDLNVFAGTREQMRSLLLAPPEHAQMRYVPPDGGLMTQ